MGKKKESKKWKNIQVYIQPQTIFDLTCENSKYSIGLKKEFHGFGFSNFIFQ